MTKTLAEAGALAATNGVYNLDSTETYGTGSTGPGTEGNDVLSLTSGGLYEMLGGHDQVTIANHGTYVVDLGEGNDRLYLDSGSQVFADGGAGLDRFYVSAFRDYELDGGDDFDVLSFTGLQDFKLRLDFTSAGGGRARELYDDGTLSQQEIVFSNMERIYGTEQSDWVDGNGADNWFDGEGGADQFFGRNGDDTFLGRDGGDFAKMGKGRDIAYGGEGDDFLGGGNGADSLYGNQGLDQIIGGLSNNIIDGGEDDDIITVYDGKATSHDGNDHYEGGTNGADDFGEVIWGDLLVFMGLQGGVEIDAQAGKAWGREAGSAKMGTDTFSGFETYDGTDHNDVYHAESGGHAMFYAFDGDDLIMAALGEHRFLGGRGIDTVDYSGVDAALRMDLSLNHSQARMYDVSTGDELGRHEVSAIENVTGSVHDDQIFGNAFDNVLEGGAGDDVDGRQCRERPLCL